MGFLGIVPVKVKNKVDAGDYIIASGKNDGFGIAVSLEDIDQYQYSQIVGVAWESSTKKDVKLIRTAVGVSSWTTLMQGQQKMIEELRSENNILKTEMEKIETIQKELENIKKILDETNK